MHSGCARMGRQAGARAAACALAAACAAALAACGGGGAGSGSSHAPVVTEPPAPTVLQWVYPPYTVPTDWHWDLPDSFAPARVPQDNPMNDAKVELGRRLFYDQRLSGNATQSCASCHAQARAFSDGLAQPIGSSGMLHPRNAMALVNVAWNGTQTWANPVLDTLEAQMLTPLFGIDPVEMGVNDANADEVLQRVRSTPDYPARFAAAFADDGSDAISWDHIIKAIGAFQRTLISVGSRYDRYLQGTAALTAQEQNGLRLFTTAQCIQCHEAPSFSGQFVSSATTSLAVRFHNVGLYNVDGKGAYPRPSQGAFEITSNPADMGAFRAPTLRNIEVSAPYMHDGSVATLEEAVAIMAGGGRNVTSGPYAGDGRTNPYKSELIRDQHLTASEQADLVAFLKTLTDHDFLNNPALSDPSGP